MRGLLISGLTLVAAACVAASLSGGSAPVAPDRAVANGLNAGSDSDRQLQIYGDAHPECRMWSNWEKLCSRIGPGGSVQCIADRDQPVLPSAPFCARRANDARPRAHPSSERRARERFCVRHRVVDDLSPDPPTRRTRICARQNPDRPFNGRRVAALLRPGCDVLADAENGRPICVRGGDRHNRLPDCAALAAAHYQSDRLLYCGRWSGPATCNALPVREPFTPEQIEEGAITFGRPDPNIAPVHGLFCENK